MRLSHNSKSSKVLTASPIKPQRTKSSPYSLIMNQKRKTESNKKEQQHKAWRISTVTSQHCNITNFVETQTEKSRKKTTKLYQSKTTKERDILPQGSNCWHVNSMTKWNPLRHSWRRLIHPLDLKQLSCLVSLEHWNTNLCEFFPLFLTSGKQFIEEKLKKKKNIIQTGKKARSMSQTNLYMWWRSFIFNY